MKEIRTTAIISQSIFDNPLVDRRVQSGILHVINYLSTAYGYIKAPISETNLAVNELLSTSYSLKPLSQETLKIFIEKFKRYGLTIEIEGEALVFEPFILQDVEPELRIDHKQIDKSLSEVFALHKPVHLIRRLEETEKTIRDLSKRQIGFLSTSKLHDRREISDKLAEMVERANEHIYIMLAFYQEDISFFANFLGNKVRTASLDLKIIYNPNDPKNRKFIQRLYDLIGTERDFFRVYDSLNLKGTRGKKFIGNLHSKAVMTEKELLVGSANFTARSMYYNIENAIYTNDVVSVKTANTFFLTLWNKLRVASAI